MISIARTFAFNTSKGLTELVIGELIIRNVVFNKKTVQGLNLFGKLIEKKAPVPSATPFVEIPENPQIPLIMTF